MLERFDCVSLSVFLVQLKAGARVREKVKREVTLPVCHVGDCDANAFPCFAVSEKEANC